MSDREIDQQLVERVQRGDKQAFGLLVAKYQRKLARLLSRLIRDSAEVEDVAQETFIKAYRALPSFRGDSAFYTWLYRIGINTAKNYLVSQGRRAPTTTDFDSEEAETFDDGDQLRDINTPERLLMTKQIGERVSLVNEMIVYGVLRGCLNAFFGGTGTTIATVNGAPTLGMIRRMTKTLKANHAMPVTSMLSSDKNYGSEAVEAGFFVYCHTNLEPDIRDMPGFTPTVKYASGKPVPNEIGKVENFRFVTSPDLPELQDAGAAIGTTGLYSTSGSLIDVYPIIVCAEDAWSQIVVRGKDALDSTYLPPSKKDKSDPHGQRGYAGTKWYKAVALENHGWMCVGYVGSKIVS